MWDLFSSGSRVVGSGPRGGAPGSRAGVSRVERWGLCLAAAAIRSPLEQCGTARPGVVPGFQALDFVQ